MAQEKKVSVGLIAFVLVFGAFAPLLDSTMVNIALNDIGHELHSSLATTQWIVTGYTLMMGIAVPLSGWAIDRFRGRDVYAISLAVFFVGSIVSALSGTMNWLIIGRLIQGFGGGLMMPALTTLIVRAAGAEKLGAVMATIGLPVMLGPVLGPILGAFIVDAWDWRMIFWVNVPITIIGVLLTYVFLPQLQGPEPTKHFDIIGISLLAATFSGVVIAISKIDVKTGIFVADVMLPFIIGVAALVGYALYAWKFPNHAIVNLSLFKNKNFVAANFLLIFMGIAINGPEMLLPLYFQNVQGDTVIHAALALVPQAVGMMITRVLGGKLNDSRGPRFAILIGLAITVIGTVPFIWTDANSSLWLTSIVLVVRGLGLGLWTAPVMTAAFIGLPSEAAGQISIATRILQNVGGSIGAGALAITVANIAMHSTLKSPVAVATHSYNIGFLVATIASLVAFIPAFFIVNKSAKQLKLEAEEVA